MRGGRTWVLGVYFPRGQQSYSEIEGKFVSDYAGVAKNQADAFVFVTNQELRRAERKKLAEAVSGPVMIVHLERLVTVLDQPRMHPIREQFLNIAAPTGLDRDQRLEELWRASLGRCAARWMSVGLPPRRGRRARGGPVGGKTTG